MTTDRRAAVPADERIKGIAKRVSPNWIGGSPVPREDVEFLLSELAAERSRRLQVEQERDELRKDVAYHSECRPNRRQAEEAIARAEAAERERDALQAKLDALPILATVQRNAELEAQIQTLRDVLLKVRDYMDCSPYATDCDEELKLVEAALAAVENGTER